MPSRLPRTSRFRAALRAMFRKQRAAVRQAWGLGRKAAGLPAPPDLTRYTPAMQRRLRPFIELCADRGGRDLLERLGVSSEAARWRVTAPRVREAVDGWTFRFCEETNRTTTRDLAGALDRLRRDLVAGITGDVNTPAELTAIVQRVFDRAEGWRATQIALTESSRATHGGERLAALASGVVWGTRWLAAADACDMCQELADEEVPLEQAFTETDYGPVFHPPLHPRCMCTVTQVLFKEKSCPGQRRTVTVRDRSDFRCGPRSQQRWSVSSRRCPLTARSMGTSDGCPR